MKVEVKTYWSDLDQAKIFAEEVSRQYPNLKLYLSLESDVKKIDYQKKNEEPLY